MLQILRNKAQSLVIQIIVVIIALVFIFWGVGTNMMNRRETAITVNDDEISFQEFQVAYDRTYNNFRNQFGDAVPQELLESLGIKEQVIQQLIQDALLRQGAAEMGVAVSKEEIQENVQKMPQFLENGSFSLDKYKSILAANGYSPYKFELSVQTDMLAQKVSEAIDGFAVEPTDAEIEELYKLDKAKVAIQYVSISPDSYLETITFSDEDLDTFYETVKDNYKSAPQIKLKYLDFSYDSVGKKISIDEAAVQTYYDEHADEFSLPEQRRARHILFKVEEDSTAEERESIRKKALEVLEMARSGEDFAELASQYSEGPTKSQGGDLGLFSKNQMVKSFDEAVFSMKPGDISDIVETPFGFHIIKLEGINPARTKPLAEVKESIKMKLQKEQAKSLAFQVANQAYEGIISAGSIDGYLQANPDTPTVETDFFTRSNPPGAFEKDPKFLEAAFALKEGELSSLVETSLGYTILSAQAIKEPAIPDLKDVRDRVIADFKKNKAEELAGASAATLLNDAKEAANLVTAAEKGGFKVEESGYLSKNNQSNKDIASTLVQEAFKLSGKEPFPAEPLQVDGSFYVFQFLGQQYPQEPLTAEEKERYSSAILRMKQQQILSAWLENRQNHAKIFTHKNL